MTRPAWTRPGGANHPFNIPVDYPIYPYPWYTHLILGHPVNSLTEPYGKDGPDYVGRLWNYGSPNQPGNFNIKGHEYTYPLYYVEDATDTYTIQGGPSEINGTSIPWNPAWTPAAPHILSCTDTSSSGDAQVIVIEKATGKEWDLWKVFVNTSTKKVCIQNGSVVGTELQKSVPGNVTANIYTKENGWILSRGMGMNYIMGLVVPEEIAAGEIQHALSMPVANPSHVFFLPPATKLERKTSPYLNTVIPEGMRFCLSASASGYSTPEDAVDAWIAVKHASKSAQVKAFARIIGIALFKYGWFITDTSGHADWQIESIASASTLWADLGINPSLQSIFDLMDGLLIGPTLQPDGSYTGGNIVALTLPACYGIYDGTFISKLQAAGLDYAAPTQYSQQQGLP